MWTLFHDMRSGGETKIKPYERIYIEASEAEAKVIFYNRLKRNPERVTCMCCGDDYSISESVDLEQATGFERGCEFVYVMPDGTEKTDKDREQLSLKGRLELNKYGRYVERQRWQYKYMTLNDYMKRDDVLIIPASEVNDSERVGEIPQEGYVWVGER